MIRWSFESFGWNTVVNGKSGNGSVRSCIWRWGDLGDMVCLGIWEVRRGVVPRAYVHRATHPVVLPFNHINHLASVLPINRWFEQLAASEVRLLMLYNETSIQLSFTGVRYTKCSSYSNLLQWPFP